MKSVPSTDVPTEGSTYAEISLNNVAVRTIFVITFSAFTAKSIYMGASFSAYIYLLMGRENSAVGFMAGVSGIVGLLLAPIVGYISDKWDRMQLVRGSSFFGFCGVLTAFYAINFNSYYLLMGSEIIFGFFWAVFTPTMDALIADNTNEGERSKSYTMSSILKNFAGALGPLTSLVLFMIVGDRWDVSTCRIVMMAGLGLFSVPLAMLLFFRKDRRGAPAGGEYGAVAVEEDDGVDDDDKQILEMASTHLKSVFSDTDVEAGGGGAEGGGDLEEIWDRELSQMTLEISRPSAANQAHYCFGNVLLVPAAIATGDVITGLASGMTIKFMPIFMLDLLELSPDKVNAVYTLSPLLVAGASLLVQRLSKTIGRCWATVFAKGIGVSLLLVLAAQASSYTYLRQHEDLPPDEHPWYCSIPAILTVFLLRTVIINTTKPLTKSIVMDMVPKQQRGRWQALESINAATWAGSAVVGGVLIDDYGFVGIFVTTAIMQLASTFPIMWIAGLVPMEEG
jgi:MFS family permease